MAINVYGYAVSKKIEKINIFTYHISEHPEEKPRINLLLISKDAEIVGEDNDDNDEEIIDENYDPDADYSIGLQKETKYDYCWIKNLNRLLYDQIKHKCKNLLLPPLSPWFHKRGLIVGRI